MKYKEYKFFTDTEKLDELIDSLNMNGITELVINDPREAKEFESGSDGFNWNYIDDSVLKDLESGAWVSFYSSENESISFATELMKTFDCKISIVDDADWLHKWEEYFVPTKIGERTVAKPVWRDYEPKEDEIVIDIDPGMAFGTGSSPTTYLTVRLMEKYLVPGENVLDVGCGTGILSVLAVKLGGGHVDAIDLDPEAVRSTKINAKLNGCDDKIDVYHKDLLKDCELKAPLIVANLTAEIVIRLLDGLKLHMEGRKMLIASGIIDDKETAVIEAMKAAGFKIVEIIKDDCWCAVAGVIN